MSKSGWVLCCSINNSINNSALLHHSQFYTIGILYNWAAHSPCNRSCDPDTGQVTADEGHVMTTKGQVH